MGAESNQIIVRNPSDVNDFSSRKHSIMIGRKILEFIHNLN